MLRWLARSVAVFSLSLGLGAPALAHPTVVIGGPAIVRPAPPIPVYVRPPCPGPSHAWVEGQWVWNGFDYAWAPGYWQQQVVYRPIYAQPAYPVYARRPVVVYNTPRPANVIYRNVPASPRPVTQPRPPGSRPVVVVR
jgi:hypothetical protein